MRRTFFTAILAGTATFCAVITEAETADPEAIAEVIGEQIAAFKQDDFATAFGFASPNIRGLFGTPERFGAMVRNGYPMVWRPSDVRFLELHEQGGEIWQEVLLSDANGVSWRLYYQMVHGPDGWRINAVEFRGLPPVGV